MRNSVLLVHFIHHWKLTLDSWLSKIYHVIFPEVKMTSQNVLLNASKYNLNKV